MKRIALALTFLALAVMTVGISASSTSRPFDIEQIVSQSQAIVIGVVRDRPVQQVSAHSVDDVVLRVEVSHSIVGVTESPLLITLHVPHNGAASAGWGGMPPLGAHRLFFLRRQGDSWIPTDQSRVSIPAVRVFEPQERAGAQVVIDNLATVIGGTDTESKDVLEAIGLIRHYSRPELLDACARRLNDADAGVRLECAALLLRRNDPRALPVLNEVLPNLEQYPWPHDLNFVYAIRDGLSDRNAIPVLARTFEKAPPAARIAITTALGRMQSDEVLPVLLHGLRDSNPDVRFAAAIGLSEITKQPEWRPSVDEFRQAERKYILHWEELLGQGSQD